MDIDFQDYRAEEGTYPVPAYILIDRPIDETRVEIKYKFFDVNQQVDQTVFRFEPPKDAPIRILETLEEPEIERLAPYKEFRVEE